MKKFTKIGLMLFIIGSLFLVPYENEAGAVTNISIDYIVITDSTDNYLISLDVYNAAFSAGIPIKTSDIEYIRLSNNKIYTMDEYNAAFSATSSLTDSLSLLDQQGSPKTVQFVEGTFNENGKPIPTQLQEEFRVMSIE